NRRTLQHHRRTSDIKPHPPGRLPNAREAKAKKAQAELQKAYEKVKRVPGRHAELLPVAPPPATTPPPAPASFNAKQLAIGFYIDWDESSYSSLERNLDHLDWVLPQWVHLVNAKPDERPIADELNDGQALKALNLIRQKRPQTSILPMLQNLDDEKWEKDLLARAVGDEDSEQRLINALSEFVEQNKFAGVCVDFEEATKDMQPNLLRFMQELYAAFKPRGWIVAQAVPFDGEGWN